MHSVFSLKFLLFFDLFDFGVYTPFDFAKLCVKGLSDFLATSHRDSDRPFDFCQYCQWGFSVFNRKSSDNGRNIIINN